MKAEWIHTDDGLTIEVTATSDIDRTNFNSFFLDKPLYRPRLRVTKTMRDAAKNYAGLHLNYLQYADQKNLAKNSWFLQKADEDTPAFWWKVTGNRYMYLLNTGVRRLKVITLSDMLNNKDLMINALLEDRTITEFNGTAIEDLGNIRTMGQITQRLRKNT